MYIYIYIYVCMYVCMYVCTYVRMYVIMKTMCPPNYRHCLCGNSSTWAHNVGLNIAGTKECSYLLL